MGSRSGQWTETWASRKTFSSQKKEQNFYPFYLYECEHVSWGYGGHSVTMRWPAWGKKTVCQGEKNSKTLSDLSMTELVIAFQGPESMPVNSGFLSIQGNWTIWKPGLLAASCICKIYAIMLLTLQLTGTSVLFLLTRDTIPPVQLFSYEETLNKDSGVVTSIS